MSLLFPIGILAAALVESLFLGTILLFLMARLWKAPAISLLRALGLCVLLSIIPYACAAVALLVLSATTNAAAILVVLLTLAIADFALQWTATKSSSARICCERWQSGSQRGFHSGERMWEWRW